MDLPGRFKLFGGTACAAVLLASVSMGGVAAAQSATPTPSRAQRYARFQQYLADVAGHLNITEAQLQSAETTARQSHPARGQYLTTLAQDVSATSGTTFSPTQLQQAFQAARQDLGFGRGGARTGGPRYHHHRPSTSG